MLKLRLLVLFCVIGLGAVAQFPVNIKGSLHGYPHGAIVSLVSYQGYIIDTARLDKGHFVFKESIPGGDYYTLYIKTHDRPASSDSLLIYLDRGKMSVTTSRNKIGETRFGGSLYARQLDSFNRIIRSTTSLPDKNFTRRINAWILNHRASPISVFAIDRYLTLPGNGTHWSVLNSLYERLDAPALNNILALRLGLNIERLNTMEPGNLFPAFSLPDSIGKQIHLSRDQGKYLLIDFWASWCGPCREENPHFNKIKSRYAGKNLDIISISLDKSLTAWMGAVHADRLGWTQLIDQQFPHSDLTHKLNLKMIPADFLVGPEGKIIARNLFGDSLDAELDHLLLH